MPRRWSAFLLAVLWSLPALADTGRERLSMDPNWRFHLGDPAGIAPGTFAAADVPANAKVRADDFDGQVSSTKARPDDFEKDAVMAARRIDPVATNVGGSLPVLSATFDDSTWRPVQLPHDWAVALPFDPRGDVSHGFMQIGGVLGNDIGWYRRSFDLPASDKGRSLSVEFDGAYRNCLVWLNGHCLGRNVSGYTSFDYNISGTANYGGHNELVVRVDASQPEGWWYEGAGIYRHVWLVKTPPVHVAHWGTFVTSDGRADNAIVIAHITVENDGAGPASFALVSRAVDTDGRVLDVARRDTPPLGPGQQHEYQQHLLVPHPTVWSLENPHLYTLLTTVRAADGTTDEVPTPFGIRTIRFDPDRGFFLNGQHVFLKGTCNHQDAAGVGVAVPDALNVWRLQQLKKMGCNAVRMSHNDPTPELLGACDRLGMLVMDEHRKSGRTPEILDQLARLVRRDRNHPSVVLWSIGNEEGWIQGSAVGATVAKAMKATIDKLDGTRPVTAAMNGGWGGGFSTVIDAQGFNYPLNTDVSKYHRKHPKQPLYASEEGSTVSTRGVYADDKAKGYVSGYDVNAPPWATTAEKWWTYYQTRPFMAGAFVWTGFDYRGEPTPYGWPCINSHFGIMDTCGFPKDNFYYYQSVWTERPMVHLLPHWNWAGREDKPIDVWVYSNGDEVELSLDGHSLGRQHMPAGKHLSWQVPYQPGTLTAKAYLGGAVVATDTVATTGAPAKLLLTTDRDTIDADGADVAVVNVGVADAQGRVVPTAGNLVHLKVDGGRNLGVGNGDPSCHEPDHGDQRSAFNGLCQMIVQSTSQPGTLTVTATADGLPPATLRVIARPCPPRPAVP